MTKGGLMLEFIDFGFIPEDRRIFTYILISLAFVLIACAVHYKIADCCDMEDFFEGGGWVTALAALGFAVGFFCLDWRGMVLVAIATVGAEACLIHFNIGACCDLYDFMDAGGWITLLIITAVELIAYGLIYASVIPLATVLFVIFTVVGAIAGIVACVLHYNFSSCYGIEDFFANGVWITALAAVILELLIAGFTYLNMVLMFIVAGFSVCGIVALYILHAIKQRRKANSCSVEYEENTEGETRVMATDYKCPHCGAMITKFVNEKAIYKCEYCGTVFDRKNLKKEIRAAHKEKQKIRINDFEEEYFEACDRMALRPYNVHSLKQIERKFDKLRNLIYEGYEIYEDVDYDISGNVLDEAHDFLTDNREEISDYLDEYTEDEIRKRYEVYCNSPENA